MDKIEFSNLTKAQIVIISLFSMISLFILYFYSKGELDTSDAVHLLIIDVLVSANLLYVAMMEEQIRVMSKRTELSIEFNPNDEAFMTYTHVPYGKDLRNSRWLRLKIKNEGDYVAKNCQGRLEEVKNEKGETLYKCSPVILHWSSIPHEITFMDISRWWFLDIVYTIETVNKLFIADIFGFTGEKTGIQRKLTEGTYIFTISICSENADPDFIKLKIKWGGKWDQLEASVIESEGGNT